MMVIQQMLAEQAVAKNFLLFTFFWKVNISVEKYFLKNNDDDGSGDDDDDEYGGDDDDDDYEQT